MYGTYVLYVYICVFEDPRSFCSENIVLEIFNIYLKKYLKVGWVGLYKQCQQYKSKVVTVSPLGRFIPGATYESTLVQALSFLPIT